MIANAVYILCALTSAACTVLLFRGYARSRSRLLLWSGLCFAALALNNVLLFVDKVVMPDRDAVGGVSLMVLRTAVALVGMALLLYGLIWDAE